MVYKTVIIFIIFGSLACIDIPRIIKKKQWRELIVYSAFILLGFVTTVLYEVFRFDFSGFTNWLIMLASNMTA
jgi:hypothetical protein